MNDHAPTAIDRSSTLEPEGLLALLGRNAPGTVFLREDAHDGQGFSVYDDVSEHRLEAPAWIRLDEHGVMPLLSVEHGFVLHESNGDHALVSLIETSFLSYGLAVQPIRALGQKRKRPRRHIRESTDSVKQSISSSQSGLRHFIALYDEYKKDPQLGSKQASISMQAILKTLYDSGADSAMAYGQVEFVPNQMAWISLMDTIGNQPLAQFLGISSVADIPGADLDDRADEIRTAAGADAVAPDTSGDILASKPRTPANIRERVRLQNVAGNHMAQYFHPARK